MNILIINQPPFNRGDESAHKALIRELLKRLSGTRIRVLSPLEDIENVRQYAVHDERLEYIYAPAQILRYRTFFNLGMFHNQTWLWNIHPTFRQYKGIFSWADWVMCAPGGICMGGFQNWGHLFLLKLAKWCGKPLAYYGRSFGPFPTETEQQREFKAFSLDMLHYFSFLSIRDHKTELIAEELGIPYVSTVDSAFLDSPKVVVPYELRSAIGDKPYMVFVPNYLLWHYAYKDRISHDTVINFYLSVIDEIFAANPEQNIVMLPQVFCGTSYATSDVELFRELADKKNDKRIIVAADCYSSDIQQAIIHDASYVIGARYHSIVFALNQGVPCIALNYEHKISGLLQTLGKEEWCVEFSDTLDSEENQQKCLSQIRELIPMLKPDLEARDRAKQIASDCLNKFIELIGK